MRRHAWQPASGTLDPQPADSWQGYGRMMERVGLTGDDTDRVDIQGHEALLRRHIRSQELAIGLGNELGRSRAACTALGAARRGLSHQGFGGQLANQLHSKYVLIRAPMCFQGLSAGYNR